MAQAQVLPQLYELDLLQQNFTIRTEDWRLLHIRSRANRVKAFDLADVKIDGDGYRVRRFMSIILATGFAQLELSGFW
jgi:hypothetical protein